MPPSKTFDRYQELRQYVGWTDADTRLVQQAAAAARPHFAELIDDFYDAIQSNPTTAKTITGGIPQIHQLKGTLLCWLEDLFSGNYDEAYVLRRWQIGMRHVRIGLDQAYTNAAIARLRQGLLSALHCGLQLRSPDKLAALRAIDKLLDLELAIINDAYHTEYVGWHNRQERERRLHAERLAAIGETMAGLVHESRNMLQRCRACLEMLEVDVADRPAALNLVERIRHAQDDLHQLFEEVREYAAPLKLDCRDCEIAPVWQKAWNELTALEPEKKIRLVEVVQPEHLHASIDRFTLGQVFRNVFENAIQASPPAGQVKVCCQLVPVDGRSDVQILIGDQGPGIPPQDREQVLEPFFTTKIKGTGLGLAIARRIIESHGGRIEVLCAPKGALIQIQIPQVQHESIADCSR